MTTANQATIATTATPRPMTVATTAAGIIQISRSPFDSRSGGSLARRSNATGSDFQSAKKPGYSSYSRAM